MAGGKASAQKARMAQRRSRALDLRIMGASYRAIAAKIAEDFSQPGYGEAAAHMDVAHALKEIQENNKLKAQDCLALENERLDKAMLSIAPAVQKGDPLAVDRWIKISESRRKLLGLDAPVKYEVASLVESELNGFLTVLEHRIPAETYREVLTAFSDWQSCQEAAATN